jgi:hypothetical protein
MSWNGNKLLYLSFAFHFWPRKIGALRAKSRLFKCRYTWSLSPSVHSAKVRLEGDECLPVHDLMPIMKAACGTERWERPGLFDVAVK